MSKWTEKNKQGKNKKQQWLNSRQRDDLIKSIQGIVRHLRLQVSNNRIQLLFPDSDLFEASRGDLVKSLLTILHYDDNNLARDAGIFKSIYGRIGILPPDMYLSLVLQATEGCSYNKCNYCSFYDGISYKVRSPAHFNRHVERVLAYFGSSITMRKTVFLGEANALDVPQARLLEYFKILNKHFTFNASKQYPDVAGHKIPMQGVYGFMTSFHKPKNVEDLTELREYGLRRVYIGMESGSAELLRFLNKPGGDSKQIVALVESIKRSGLNAGIIILLGAGGDIFYSKHVAETIRVVRSMPLTRGDMLYFSPIDLSVESGHRAAIRSQNGNLLSRAGMQQQKQAIIEGLDYQSKVDSPKTTLYNISEFIY
jgi:radical SAM superfamily enzyme YgiQ (UPF0313 family)